MCEDSIEGTSIMKKFIAFCLDDIKMSIGLERDNWYSPDGIRKSEYDYDVDYLENGMAYLMFPFTKTERYLFGISWIMQVTKDNDAQTWYGADLFYYKRGY